jgi:hypothetical protein
MTTATDQDRREFDVLLGEMNDHLGDIGYSLAKIALSDDPVEERVRKVETFARGLRLRIDVEDRADR